MGFLFWGKPWWKIILPMLENNGVCRTRKHGHDLEKRDEYDCRDERIEEFHQAEISKSLSIAQGIALVEWITFRCKKSSFLPTLFSYLSLWNFCFKSIYFDIIIPAFFCSIGPSRYSQQAEMDVHWRSHIHLRSFIHIILQQRVARGRSKAGSTDSSCNFDESSCRHRFDTSTAFCWGLRGQKTHRKNRKLSGEDGLNHVVHLAWPEKIAGKRFVVGSTRCLDAPHFSCLIAHMS